MIARRASARVAIWDRMARQGSCDYGVIDMGERRAGQVVTTGGGIGAWPHEERTARCLAEAGMDVRFIRKSDDDHMRTPDVLINGESWEMKAPVASNARC